MTTATPFDLDNLDAMRTTTDPAAARRFANPDEADRTARTLRNGYGCRWWPLADFDRHPHGTDRARGFAVSPSPGCWIAS